MTLKLTASPTKAVRLTGCVTIVTGETTGVARTVSRTGALVVDPIPLLIVTL
jgi:hypothetical protein